MEPITTVLTGIALVKQSVDFIKSNIETVKDIGQIAGSIEALLNGEQEIQKSRFSKKSIISQTKDAASSVIDAKLAQEAMQEMRFLVDFRFGVGTWQSIIDERARRLSEEREIAEEERKEKLRRKTKLKKTLQNIFLSSGIGILLIVGAMGGFIYLSGGL
jgi:hypothetical protein